MKAKINNHMVEVKLGKYTESGTPWEMFVDNELVQLGGGGEGARADESFEKMCGSLALNDTM